MSKSLRVETLFQPKLAFTNAVYLNPGDYTELLGDSGEFVTVGDGVYCCRFRDEVPPGTVQMSTLQRTAADVSLNESVMVSEFDRSSSPPCSSITFQISSLQRAVTSTIAVDVESLAQQVQRTFAGHLVKWQQQLAIESTQGAFRLLVTDFTPVDIPGKVLPPPPPGSVASAGAGAGSAAVSRFASIERVTEVHFEKAKDAKLELRGGAKKTQRIFDKGFNFEKMGIGGLDKEFGDIFRRAFASRLYPDLMREFGMNHVRGMLLYGPPGCGKTLIARKIGAALHAKEPKKVNGPEILNKYVGQSEENIRELFAEAEADQKTNGDESELHIIIFDEIDAICKQRGSSKDGTGVHDSIVNQLLSKIDGVDSLNNILLIGMTNRKDLIDEALLRPGRLEVHVEIGLPDEFGRTQILGIHTAKIKRSGRLHEDVDLATLAHLTKNFTGAELEGLIKDALSFALARVQDAADPTKPADPKAIMLVMDDFLRAVDETIPAFGMRESELRSCFANGIVSHGAEFERLARNVRSFIKQVATSERTNVLSVLLEGPPGSGKSAFAAKMATESGFPYVKRMSPDSMVGMSEFSKASALHKAFEDAYKSPLSIVILDDIERLIDYVPLGQRFSNVVLQNLLVLCKRAPPVPERKILIIGTTSNPGILDAMGLEATFHVKASVPMLNTPDQIKAVLADAGDVDQAGIGPMASTIRGPIGIKKLLLVLEMARQTGSSITADSFAQACLICGVDTDDGLLTEA